jgi:hypothetical protein
MSQSPQIGSQGTAAFRKVQQEARVRSSHIGVPTYKGNASPRSGVQPDARGMVLCPFCNKTFPFSAALLNRQLRCNGCRSIFRVAEDRRSFRIQAAEIATNPDSGSLSKMTRSAIRQANVSLNEAAAEALRAVSKQNRGAPPGSGSAIRARPATPPTPPKSNIPKNKQSEVVLTGEGEAKGRGKNQLLLIGLAITIIGCLVLWLVARSDPLRDALWKFQAAAPGTLTWSASVAALRQASFSSRVDPVIGIDGAVFGPTQSMDMSRFESAVATLRAIDRGGVFVDQSRLSEAKALGGKYDLSSQSGVQAFQMACMKAGITVRTWEQIIAEACEGQPDGMHEVFSLLMSRPAPRSGEFDPVLLIGQGELPSALDISPFSGTDGAILQPSGPAVRPAAFQGRLIRFAGKNWPDRWMMLDLHIVKP